MDLYLSFLLGIIASFVAGIILVYWQFNKSIAGYRLNKVEDATRLIINKMQSNDTYIGTLRNRYRYSLGVFIDILTHTYGAKNISKVEGQFPSTLNNTGDGWELFNNYVRPVINDINVFSFIGWFTLLPQMKKLKILVNLCNQLENTTAELDSIREYQNRNKIKILDFLSEGSVLKIIPQNDENAIAEINALINEYDKLENCWNEWLNATINNYYIQKAHITA